MSVIELKTFAVQRVLDNLAALGTDCHVEVEGEETREEKSTYQTHLAGAGVIPLQIAPEKMLVFSESLPYTRLEIGLKTIFHLWP